MNKSSRAKRPSRLFSGTPDMLLVEEYLGSSRPDPELLPLHTASVQAPELVEMPDEEDHSDEDEEDEDNLQRVVLQNRAAARAPVRVNLPPPLARPEILSHGGGRTASPTPSLSSMRLPGGGSPPALSRPTPGASAREIIEMAPEPLFVGKRAEPLRIALPTRPEEEPSLVLAAAAPEDYDDDEDEDWDEDEGEDEGAADAGEDEDEDESSNTGSGVVASIAVGLPTPLSPSPSSSPRAALRLSLDSEQMEDLRNLEERRRFEAPIWGPAPGGNPGFDDDISLFDESEEEEDDVGLFEESDVRVPEPPRGGGAGASLRIGTSGGGERGGRRNDAFVIDEGEEEEDLRAFHRAHRAGFVLDEEESEDDSSSVPVAAVRISPFAREAEPSARVPVGGGDPLDPPEVVGWEGPGVPPLPTAEPTPEADPVRSYGALPDDDPTQPEEDRPFPRATPEESRPRAAAVETAGTPWVTSLIWLTAVLCLLSVGGWAAYVLVQELLVPAPVVAPADRTDGETPEAPIAEDPESAPPTPEVVPPEATSAEGGGIDPAQRLDMNIGKLMIATDRKSTVYINGKKIGTTPLEPLDLEAGVYEVRVVALSTGRSRSTRVRVDVSKVTQIELNFQ